MLLTRAFRQTVVRNPLEGHDQIVLVVSRTQSADAAKMVLFDREGDSWRFKQTAPAVIGANGMAWGRGLHDSRESRGEEVKREGDGRSPEGVFELSGAYGYRPKDAVNIRFPYTQTTPDMVCIDEVRSAYYAMIVKSDSVGLDPSDMPSHEDMLRDDNLYKYLIVVGHNTADTERGAGSCIFIHLWRDERTATAGCTAVSEPVMLQLLGWLDPSKKPVLVQLTRKNYNRLKAVWGLPDITI